MTNHEILKASLLDILFENKNKQYGAYTLRKYYDQRMIIALTTCIGSALLLFYLISISGSSMPTISEVEKDPVVFTHLELPRNEEPLPEPQRAHQQPAQQAATIDHNNIHIVPDQQVLTTEVPTVDNIAVTGVSDVTQAGTPDIGQPASTAPSNSNGNGNVIDAPATDNHNTFIAVERQPEFPGGKEAWINFLNKHLQSPDELQAGERRTVHVRFEVSADGVVTNFIVVQSGGSSFDREVIRVLKKMPKWKPAIQNGRPISISFVQPVTFQSFEE
jgi:protein TonB